MICWHPYMPISVNTTTFWECITSRSLWLITFNHPWLIRYFCIASSCLVPLDLFNFLKSYISCQFRFLILTASCCGEAPWFSIVLKISEKNYLSGSYGTRSCQGCFGRLGATGFTIAALTLLLFKGMYYTGRSSLPQSVRWKQSWLYYRHQRLPVTMEEIGRLVCLCGCKKQCHLCP